MNKQQRDELIAESQRLIDESQRLRRELAIAYQLKEESPVQPPEDWHEEADRRGLWKMFR
jgi:hypothetical protein